MPRPWTLLARRYLLRRRWMTIREDHVRLPNGTEIPDFHVLELPDWTCVLCTTEKGEVVLVEQYRQGIGRMSLEFPAGVVDDGEEVLAAAKRELLEETGYVAEAWSVLGHCASDPSKHTNTAHLFIAQGARKVAEPRPEASEVIRVRLLPVDALLELADQGQMLHGIHLAALFWARHRGWPGVVKNSHPG